MGKKKKLVLFDAHAIIHRAYHALPDFVSSQGEPTGGLYGVATMLMRIISDLKPDYLVACFDRAETTFRKQAYEGYKAGRPKAEAELIAQLIRARDIFTAFGIPIYDAPGFEADDIIGTIVEKLKTNNNLQIIIASGDMDTLQLVKGDRVIVYTLRKGLTDTVIYDEKNIRERYGFAPALIADFKGLKGDPSDNIIGVSGVGDKTATILIQEFGSIEQIFKKLKKDEKIFINRGVKTRIVNLLKENEEEAIFSKTLATIRYDAPIEFSLPEKTWTETFSFFPVEKIFMDLEFRSLIGRLKNLKFGEGLKIKEESSKNEEEIDPEDIRRVGVMVWLLNSDLTVPKLEDILQFAGCDNLLEAEKLILNKLKDKGLEKVWLEIEKPLLPIIKSMEKRGVLIDTVYLKKLSQDYHIKLSKLENEVYEFVEETFNINSPKQLGEVLFDKLKLSVKGLKKTATGARSTRESELLKLKGIHPVIEKILEYRELQKLLSTYIDNIPTMLDHENVLHATFNQNGTTTGRMSSNNPNLQNIPARAGLGTAVRGGFVARPGFKLLSFDYSQIELRVLAALSGDPNLTAVFKENKDIHSAVASKVFGVKEEAVTKEMRRRAKVINFGIIYGMGVNALKTSLSATKQEAEQFMANYFLTFPTIKNYFEGVVTNAKIKGYTETLFGRRRYLPALRSPLPQILAAAERMAMNAPLQGTAADIIKLSMIEGEKRLKEAGLGEKAHLLLQIHDELIYETAEDVVEEVKKIICLTMEKTVKLPVPLLVSYDCGRSWFDL
ncbi:MAG: DNA polymerase [Candidatus Paceibacterota bacterium]|jgi:DNA polymerase-1